MLVVSSWAEAAGKLRSRLCAPCTVYVAPKCPAGEVHGLKSPPALSWRCRMPALHALEEGASVCCVPTQEAPFSKCMVAAGGSLLSKKKKVPSFKIKRKEVQTYLHPLRVYEINWIIMYSLIKHKGFDGPWGPAVELGSWERPWSLLLQTAEGWRGSHMNKRSDAIKLAL